jgi:hypothetical protein
MEPDAYTLWHRRLGHVGEEKVRLLQTNVEGIPCLGLRMTDLRDLCADQERKNHQSGRVRAYETVTTGLYRFLGAIRRPHVQRGKVYTHVHGRLQAAVVDLSD